MDCLSIKYGKVPTQVNTDTGIIDVSLTIRNVTRATYKVYNLVASNRIGRTEMNIAFMEGKSCLNFAAKFY